MGISSISIDNAADLTKEITAPIKGLSVVVLDVPNREANADQIKDLAEKMKSLLKLKKARFALGQILHYFRLTLSPG